jgi:hypothetical protein
MKATNLKVAIDWFSNGPGRSITLESSDGTSTNCTSLDQAKQFFKDHPEVKEKKVEAG